MKRFLLLIALLIVCSQTAFSQITAAMSVDGSNNLVYPLDGRVYITNTNAEFRFSGSNSVLNVTNSLTNGLIRSDDVIVRDVLVVSNTFTNVGVATFNTNVNISGNLTNIGNAIVGGTLTVTNAATLINNLNVGGTLTVTNAATLINNLNVGGTLTVTSTVALNTNVNISGNLTNTGTIIINTANTVADATNRAVRKDYVDNFPLILSYDATGVANETTSISNFLTTVAPPASYPTGKEARVFSVLKTYSLSFTTNTGTFMTGFGISLATNTGTFMTSYTVVPSLTTNTSALRLIGSPGNVLLTNNVNVTNFTSIDPTGFTLTTNTSTGVTGITATLTTNTGTAMTGFSVSITTNVTRKLYTWVDVGTTWSNSTIVTNTGLQ